MKKWIGRICGWILMSAGIGLFLVVVVGTAYTLKWWSFAFWGGLGLLGAMFYAVGEWR